MAALYRPGIWNTMLSYVSDIKLEKLHSPVSGDLEVVLSRARVQLNTLNATYSFEDLYTSYGTALQKINIEKKQISSVLVLGLGLGSIPYILQNKYKIDCIIDCVDIDPLIIQLARKYYPLPAKLMKLSIHNADAFDWMMQNDKKYDLITVDLFVDREVPKKLHQKNFIESLRHALAKNGTILFSRLKSNRPIEYLLWENLYTVFENGHDIETMGNAIYCWKNI